MDDLYKQKIFAALQSYLSLQHATNRHTSPERIDHDLLRHLLYATNNALTIMTERSRELSEVNHGSNSQRPDPMVSSFPLFFICPASQTQHDDYPVWRPVPILDDGCFGLI